MGKGGGKKGKTETKGDSKGGEKVKSGNSINVRHILCEKQSKEMLILNYQLLRFHHIIQ